MSTTTSLLSKDAVASMRINYKSHGLQLAELKKKEPFAMFDAWFKMAKECPLIKEARSMSLSTVSKDGKPSARIVLLGNYDTAGFKFFTSYNSRKGKDMENNSNVSLLFYWEPLDRQVQIEGKVKKLSDEESTQYFQKWPRGNQLCAIASNQSQIVESGEVLQKHFKDAEKTYDGVEIPKPDNWGGYQLEPEVFEFWCTGNGSMMYERVMFRKPRSTDTARTNAFAKTGDGGWLYEYLSP